MTTVTTRITTRSPMNSEYVATLVKLALRHTDPIVRAEAASHLTRMGLPVGPRAMVIAARRDHEEQGEDHQRRETECLLELLDLDTA